MPIPIEKWVSANRETPENSINVSSFVFISPILARLDCRLHATCYLLENGIHAQVFGGLFAPARGGFRPRSASEKSTANRNVPHIGLWVCRQSVSQSTGSGQQKDATNDRSKKRRFRCKLVRQRWEPVAAHAAVAVNLLLVEQVTVHSGFPVIVSGGDGLAPPLPRGRFSVGITTRLKLHRTGKSANPL